jgi:hypothetical protein
MDFLLYEVSVQRGDAQYCEQAAAAGHTIRSVRAIFEEGEPIFEASRIRSQSHVQIAVRDLTAILEIEEVAW